MKKIFQFLLLIISFAASAQDIPPAPNPPRLVNDFTGTLTPDQAETLNRKLYLFDDSTSTQITVVIIKTTDGMDIADYALELGRKWGVGQKGNNNGVVLLIAKDDHKLNISPGYGLEKALSDVTCKQIIDYTIVPKFKGDDYYRGIDEGTDAIIEASRGEYQAPEGYNKSKGKGGGLGRIIFIIVIIVVFLAISGGKGGGGSFMSRRGFAAWTIGNMLSSGGSG
ncbi:MAG: TPM domain-containing protein, partial [Ferruginibacter sp.]